MAYGNFSFLAAQLNEMKKLTVLLCASGLLAMASCNTCYDCKKTLASKTSAGFDTTLLYQTELCRNGAQGAGTNLQTAVDDIRANGYTCNKK